MCACLGAHRLVGVGVNPRRALSTAFSDPVHDFLVIPNHSRAREPKPAGKAVDLFPSKEGRVRHTDSKCGKVFPRKEDWLQFG